MITKDLKYLVLSDIHFGHRKVKTSEIISNLTKYFDDFSINSQFSNLDIIFIAGDLFDSLLDFASIDVHEIIIWLSRLFNFCNRFDIVLRILEGTPSHDWGQSKIADTILKTGTIPIYFRYIDTLSIEFLEDLQLHILYLPDEWTADAVTTFKQVKQLLKDNNLEQVDITIMHGGFKYQMPYSPNSTQTHNEDDYLSITKYFINVGHIHSFSTYDRILAQGSFTRLAHGEEEAKGGIVCYLSKSGESSFNFIENKEARIFKTIELKSLDIDRSLETIVKVLSKLPDNSYIRIKAKMEHPIFIGFEELKIKFPMFYFSKVNFDEPIVKDVSVNFENDYTPITITKTNIVPLLIDEINKKHMLDSAKLIILSNVLEGTI